MASPSSQLPPVLAQGNTAVVTGGAQGIGLALAKRCADVHGMRVIVADWDEALLAYLEAQEKRSKKDNHIMTLKMDVSKLEDWAKLKNKVDKEFGGKVNLLALNAGIARPPSSWTDPSSFSAILDVNLYGVINGIATFLPSIKALDQSSTPASIVITGSKQGITNPPGNPAYNASKSAVKTVAECLNYELHTMHPNVSVHLLVPGWTYTGMTGGDRPDADGDSNRRKPNGAWWPDQVVDYFEKKMAEGQFYILCPDNDVNEETDRKRMLWTVGDAIHGRPPLTRWREEWKEKAQEWIDKYEFSN